MVNIIELTSVNIGRLEGERDENNPYGLAEVVLQQYNDAGYNREPKNTQEAKQQGKSGFNGLQSSFVNMTVENGNFNADLIATRYLIGQAMRDLVKNNSLKEEEAIKISPDMANSSIVAVTTYDGAFYTLSQIKGKALGSGQIHTAIAAGNIGGNKVMDLTFDPFYDTGKREANEEVGLTSGLYQETGMSFFVDERITGQVNLALLVRGDFATIANNYENFSDSKNLEPEVKGIVLQPLEGNFSNLDRYIAFVPGQNGLERTSFQDLVRNNPSLQNDPFRPYTQAFIGYFEQGGNKKVIEASGLIL